MVSAYASAAAPSKGCAGRKKRRTRKKKTAPRRARPGRPGLKIARLLDGLAASRTLLRNGLIEFAPRWALRHVTLSTRDLGRAGENFGARALRRAGWKILGRRVVTPHGEVDLVLAGAGQLVCVEVKAGRVGPWQDPLAGLPDSWNPQGRPGRRLGWEQLQRQKRAGQWLARRLEGGRLQAGRVDLVEVLLERGSSRLALLHHPWRRVPLGEGSEKSSPARAFGAIHPESAPVRYKT